MPGCPTSTDTQYLPAIYGLPRCLHVIQLVWYGHGDWEGDGRAGLRWWFESGVMEQTARGSDELFTRVICNAYSA
jgi:hypothetical protein